MIVEATAEASCRHLVQPQNWLVWICDPAKGKDLNVLKSTDRAQNRLGVGKSQCLKESHIRSATVFLFARLISRLSV